MRHDLVIHDLQRLAPCDAHEGPAYVADEHAVYFTTVPRAGISAIARLRLVDGQVDVVVGDANRANGMVLDRAGDVLVCEQGTVAEPARISRLDRRSGTRRTVVDSWRGKPFNSPNDVVVGRDGAVWFTDPSYGHAQGFRPEPCLGDCVYRHDPRTGATNVVADEFDKPNGLAFAADGRTLYVTDSGEPRHVVAFDVVDGRHLRNRRLFTVTTTGFPDGLKTDTDGRVYVSADTGVEVFDAEGELAGEIPVPGAVNFTFGGPARDVLFVTNDDAIWAATLQAKGA